MESGTDLCCNADVRGEVPDSSLAFLFFLFRFECIFWENNLRSAYQTESIVFQADTPKFARLPFISASFLCWVCVSEFFSSHKTLKYTCSSPGLMS